jgi:hypothetical protein
LESINMQQGDLIRYLIIDRLSDHSPGLVWSDQLTRRESLSISPKSTAAKGPIARIVALTTTTTPSPPAVPGRPRLRCSKSVQVTWFRIDVLAGRHHTCHCPNLNPSKRRGEMVLNNESNSSYIDPGSKPHLAHRPSETAWRTAVA